MNNFLDDLILGAVNPVGFLRPRLPNVFESPQNQFTLAGNEPALQETLPHASLVLTRGEKNVNDDQNLHVGKSSVSEESRVELQVASPKVDLITPGKNVNDDQNLDVEKSSVAEGNHVELPDESSFGKMISSTQPFFHDTQGTEYPSAAKQYFRDETPVDDGLRLPESTLPDTARSAERSNLQPSSNVPAVVPSVSNRKKVPTGLVKSVSTSFSETPSTKQISPIHITIGRVEVRAVMSPKVSRTDSPKGSPKMSLATYLEKKDGSRS